MPWIPYNKRPANLRQKLEAKIKSSDPEKVAFDYYNAQELGLINDEQFDKHIQESFSFNPIQKAAKMNENANDEQRINAPLNEGDAFSAKSLRYLKSNGNSVEDRRFAETLYYDILIDLWRQHVMQTGETYYPPLAEDLYELYRFNQDQL